jgi:acetyltransferase
VDFDRELALLAEHHDENGRPSIVGVARLMREHSGNSAEIAFVVSDKFQRRGLGSYLLQQTIAIAKQEGISSIHAVVLYENSGMRNLFQRSGFNLSDPEAGVVSAHLELREA